MTITVRTSPSRALAVVDSLYRPMSLLDELERFVRDIWDSETPGFYHAALSPRTDVYEEKDELVIRTELPGIQKEAIGISLEGDCLTIKAEKESEEVAEDATYYSCERCFGDYSRVIRLPFAASADKISATFENGLLEIRLPKAEEARPKHIEVKPK